MSEEKHTGSCLCGGVAYEATGPMRPVIACHCTQCRKTTGHYFASTQIPQEKFRLTKAETLSWFASSDTAERGFCTNCGSSLFWRRYDEDMISFTAGTLDGDTGLEIGDHIFTDTKGDYYDIP